MPPEPDGAKTEPWDDKTSSDLGRPGGLGTAAPLPLEVIGPYRLLSVLGEGGMGAVYLAEQTEPLHRTVAVKLIRGWRTDPEALRRFAAERRALALMNHPHIAQVFDAGATGDGVPYFVMEHVEGEPITRYCDRKGLGARERIAVFLPLCAAIQHAHQKGIIHRDLKPSNVLVAERDGEAVLKVIDFGIAKGVKQSLADGLTVGPTLVGTPTYMSPEQLRAGEGWDVDTRADVYALGVVLYELLAGAPPFRPEAGLLQLAQRVLNEDPPPPSTLAPRLRGDLDCITLKAIEKERERRYSSAAELQADLERFLRDEPVQATPPSRGYRVRKFVARHRGGVAAAALATAALVAGAVAATIGLVRAREAQRRTAQAEEQARAVSGFLEGMLSSADPGRDGRDVKVVDVLSRASARIEAESAGDALLRARLQHAIGKTWLGLGQTREARPLLEAALRTRSERLGASDATALESQAALALLLMTEGLFPRAQEVNAEVLQRRRETLGPDHLLTLESQSLAAQVAIRQGQAAEAAGMARATLDAVRRTLGEDHVLAFEVRDVLGWSLMRQGRLAEAEENDRGTLDLYRRHRGERHVGTLTAESSLAHTLLERGQHAEAEALLRHYLDVGRSVLGPDHPDMFNARYKRGMALMGQQRYGDAEAALREALEGQTRLFSASHPEAVTTLSHLALAVLRQGRKEDARALVRRGLSFAGGGAVLGARLNFAAALVELGQPAEALSLLGPDPERGAAPPDALEERARQIREAARAAPEHKERPARQD
jgi:non-specific serine/threonine protein kinase/serine/threonine-protein kinase